MRKGGIDMMEISLTQGQVALVDDGDYEILNQYKWYANSVRAQGKKFYAYRNVKMENGKKTAIVMHRTIIEIPEGFVCDHIDGNGLNNQKTNLRAVSSRQNSQNFHIDKSSKYPGVHWCSKKQNWTACIWYNNKSNFLGEYDSEIDAFRAYYDFVLSVGQEILDFTYPAIPLN